MNLQKLLSIISFTLLCFIETNVSCAQSNDSLHVLINKMQRGENDSIRFHANVEFQKRFLEALNQSASFENKFAEFKNVSVISTEDKSLKICTWTYPNFVGDKYFYYGYIQIKNEKTDSVITFPLLDSTSTIIKPESEKLNSNRWIGSVYYAVNKVKYKGQNYFVLLGWKGFNQQVTKKVIEVCFMDDDVLKFGYPLFKSGSVYKNRMYYSFASQATMSIRFENNGKKIVLDHISAPKSKQEVDLSNQSGPDGTYDSFILKKGRYILDKDVDARSETAPTKSVPEPVEK